MGFEKVCSKTVPKGFEKQVVFCGLRDGFKLCNFHFDGADLVFWNLGDRVNG
jgi:hypothetical protein